MNLKNLAQNTGYKLFLRWAEPIDIKILEEAFEKVRYETIEECASKIDKIAQNACEKLGISLDKEEGSFLARTIRGLKSKNEDHDCKADIEDGCQTCDKEGE